MPHSNVKKFVKLIYVLKIKKLCGVNKIEENRNGAKTQNCLRKLKCVKLCHIFTIIRETFV